MLLEIVWGTKIAMVWRLNQSTEHHQEDTDYYCGAATAQMILHSIGAGLMSQDTLYTTGHSANTEAGWFIDPDGLAYVLNSFKPATFGNVFVPFAKSTEVEGTEKIVYTLWKYQVATGTLVYNQGHWIVVHDVSTSVEPEPGETYTINGFYVNNPFPECPSFDDPPLAPPPPHSNADGCGSGGDRGVANQYISYGGWKSTYFVGCGLWPLGQYVSVCDPDAPRLGNLNKHREEFWAQGNRLITAEEAIEYALRGIEVHELVEDPIFAPALEGAQPAEPILVQHLDVPDTFYYLVPMEKSGGITALLSVNGLYGNFEGGQAFRKPVRKLFLTRQDIVERLLGSPVELGEKLGRAPLREGAFCFYPIMVWKPCQESRSPYYPFHMITVGNWRIYVGYDGTVYSELHDFGPGG